MICTLTSWLKNVFVRITPHSCHPWWAVERLFLVVSSLWLFPRVFPSPCSSLSTSTCTLTWIPSSMWTTPRQFFLVLPPTEESCTLAEFTPPTLWKRRSPREQTKSTWGRQERDTCTAGPGARERRRGVHSSQGGRAEDPKPWWRTWWSRHQRRSASEHPRHAQRRGPPEGQLVMQFKQLGHQRRAGRRDGRSQKQRGGHREWQNEEWQRDCRRADWKEGEKEFCLVTETKPPRRPGTGYQRGNLQVGADRNQRDEPKWLRPSRSQKPSWCQWTRQRWAHGGGGARCPQDWRPKRRHPSGNRPAKGRVVEECGTQCERNGTVGVLDNFEIARCERNGTTGIKWGRVTIALDDRTSQVDGTTPKRKTRLKKEGRRWRHHGNEILKSENGRQSTSRSLVTWRAHATSSLWEMGAADLPDSCKDARDAKRRES